MLKLALIIFLISEINGSFFFNGITNQTVDNCETLECHVLKQTLEDTSKKDMKYSIGTDYLYLDAPTSKCFSFKVRATKTVCIAFSSMPQTTPNMLEILLAHPQVDQSIIRDRSNMKHLVTIATPNIINPNEYHGFWVKWKDNGFVEIGRESESKSFLSHQYRPMTVNYIAVLAWQNYGSWIIHNEPRCPGQEEKQPIKEHLTELKCDIIRKPVARGGDY